MTATPCFTARFTRHEVPEDLPEVKLTAKGTGLALSQVLKQAGLVHSQPVGTAMVYCLNAEALEEFSREIHLLAGTAATCGATPTPKGI